MNKKCISHIAKVLCATMGAFAVATPLVGCNEDKKYSNEDTPLVLATDALDGVFNPFFYTSGADGEVVAQTQIGMLTSDTSGQPKAGWDEACVAFDYSTVQTGTQTGEGGDKDYSSFYTDYYFAIKDNVRFSDGVLLTSDDVLFNIYMYLDPAYTGSSTMYSVDIQGLTAYRAQSEDEGELNATDAYYDSEAASRINMIYDWIDDKNANWDDLTNYEYYDVVEEPNWKVIEKDVEKAEEYFKEELESDYVVAMASDPEKDYEKYKGADGKVLITEKWQVFLQMYNIIKFESHYGDDGKVAYYTLVNDYSLDTEKDTLLQYVYDSFLGEDLKTKTMIDTYKKGLFNVITYYSTARRLVSYVRASCINHDLDGKMKVKTVKGIEILKNQSSIPYSETPVNKTDDVPTRALKDEENNAKSYDVLHIRINGVDPKAIQNFSFTVAPGHYYSSEWSRVVNGESDFFGVKFSDPDFMQTVRTKLVPLGAGPYRATTRDGSSATDTIEKSKFLDNNIVYLERNTNFLLGAPKIKKLRFKVVSSNKLYDAVYNEEVHYASPSMDSVTVQKLENSKELTYAKADNLGYGYIGISAKYIPNINIRRAIMTTLDPSLPVSYYGGENYASAIYRPMSKTLWTYNENWGPYADDKGNDYAYDESGEKARYYLEKAGCVWDGKSYTYNKSKLKYTFTIAGDSDDHPAASMLQKSMDILNNKCGMEITLSHDSTALSKLANGQLTVWAAAWSSSSDPDMYQVYHKDSKATSTLAWGYDFIQSDKNTDGTKDEQQSILKDLSDLIEDGRKTLSRDERIEIYDEAQDLLMQLAVEFPTYQRKVYYVWRRGVFNESSMFTGADVSTYQSPLSEIWNVSFNEG